MNSDVRKLMQFDHVNYQRAKRLLKEFGSYEDVMGASYHKLMETHYIGEKTANSIFHKKQTKPTNLLQCTATKKTK